MQLLIEMFHFDFWRKIASHHHRSTSQILHHTQQCWLDSFPYKHHPFYSKSNLGVCCQKALFFIISHLITEPSSSTRLPTKKTNKQKNSQSTLKLYLEAGRQRVKSKSKVCIECCLLRWHKRSHRCILFRRTYPRIPCVSQCGREVAVCGKSYSKW